MAVATTCYYKGWTSGLEVRGLCLWRWCRTWMLSSSEPTCYFHHLPITLQEPWWIREWTLGVWKSLFYHVQLKVSGGLRHYGRNEWHFDFFFFLVSLGKLTTNPNCRWTYIKLTNNWWLFKANGYLNLRNLLQKLPLQYFLAFSSGSVLGLSCTCFGTHSLSGEEGISHALCMGM